MIILGIGSNLSSKLGDRFTNIDKAISYLKSYQIKIIKKSSYYETPAYPNIKDPKFINIIVAVDTTLDPVNFASVLIFIEKKLGRIRKKRNEPRTCDIDIIDFHGKVINFQYEKFYFTVPHEKLIYRNFVLIPLNEIDYKWKHPITKEPINTLIEKLSDEDKKSILKIEKT